MNRSRDILSNKGEGGESRKNGGGEGEGSLVDGFNGVLCAAFFCVQYVFPAIDRPGL